MSSGQREQLIPLLAHEAIDIVQRMIGRMISPEKVHFDANAKHRQSREFALQAGEYGKVLTVNIDLHQIDVVDPFGFEKSREINVFYGLQRRCGSQRGQGLRSGAAMPQSFYNAQSLPRIARESRSAGSRGEKRVTLGR